MDDETRQKRNEYQREWYQRNKERIRAERNASGRDAARAREYYWAHRDERIAYERNRDPAIKAADNRGSRQKLRREGFEHYGSVCACCGEANLKFLTFDHPNNDGAAHKIELAGSYFNASSSTVLRKLRSLGWPAGVLVVLCWNCNSGRQYNGGICPHRE